MRWIRLPVLRFVAIGIVCFAANRWWLAGSGSAVSRGEIVITATQIEQLRSEYARDTGLPLTPEATTALVQRAIDDELLYREALGRGLQNDDRSIEWQLAERMQFLDGTDDDAMGAPRRTHLARTAFNIGLHQGDAVIRRMLIEKMRLLAAYNGAQTAPTDAEIEAYMTQHADEYCQPERFTFWHVFLGREQRPATMAGDARSLLDTLQQTQTLPADAVRLGDAFAIAPHVVAQPAERLRATFGSAFTTALAEIEPGRWVGPISSPYGLHLVWLHERISAQWPPLDRVRSQIVRRLRAEQRIATVRQFISQLGNLYTVRIEAEPGGTS